MMLMSYNVFTINYIRIQKEFQDPIRIRDNLRIQNPAQGPRSKLRIQDPGSKNFRASEHFEKNRQRGFFMSKIIIFWCETILKNHMYFFWRKNYLEKSPVIFCQFQQNNPLFFVNLNKITDGFCRFQQNNVWFYGFKRWFSEIMQPSQSRENEESY